MTEPIFRPSLPKHHALMSDKYTGVDAKTRYLAPERSKTLNADVINAVRTMTLVHPKYISEDMRKSAAAALKFPDIADDTYLRPKTREEIHKVIHDFMNAEPDAPGAPWGERVISMLISAKDLAYVHPGSVTLKDAEHLHFYNDGLMTKHRYDDEDKIVIVWRYPKPKPGQLFPDPLQLTDGSLAAAFLAKDAGDIKYFEDYQARVMDYLHGNKHAMNPSRAKRVYRGTVFRFLSYLRAMAEGFSTPRFNGSIGANLMMTSLPISAFLYFVFYFVDFAITKERVDKYKTQQLQQQNGAAAAA